MAAKEAVNVEELLQWGNAQLARTEEFITQDFKCGIATMLEKVLMSAGAYYGYNYIDVENCGLGESGYYSRIYNSKK